MKKNLTFAVSSKKSSCGKVAFKSRSSLSDKSSLLSSKSLSNKLLSSKSFLNSSSCTCLIGVSGTPGVGKSTFAKKLADELRFAYVSITDLVKSKQISAVYDKKSKVWDVDPTDVDNYLKTNKIHHAVIDSLLAHHLKTVDVVVVCTCEIHVLSQRLLARKYSKQKIRENLDAEIFKVCLIESLESGKETIPLDCTSIVNDKIFSDVVKKVKRATK